MLSRVTYGLIDLTIETELSRLARIDKIGCIKVAGMQAGSFGCVARGGVVVKEGHDVNPPGNTSRVNVAATVVDTIELEVRLTVKGEVHKR